MSTQTVELVPLSQLVESPTNPRKHFDKASLEELTQSVKEKGIVIPITVRPLSENEHKQIVIGARRYRAAKAAGLKEIPCFVKELSDQDALELQVIENLQRLDIHPLEEAEAYAALRKEFGYSVEQVGTKVGKSTSYVWQRLKFMDLIEPVKKMFRERAISAAHATQVARLQREQQKECVPWLKRGDSIHGLIEEIQRNFFLVLGDAPFDTSDAKLVPAAGSCTDCPKRTGANKLLFPDIKQADVCTDSSCYENKVRAFIKIQVGTHPDAVLLTIGAGGYTSQKSKGLTEWVKAGETPCPDVKEGVVVEQLSGYYGVPERQKVKVGQVLKVCTNLKCKTHNPREVGSGSDSSWRKEFNAKMKVRRGELRRRGMIFKELAASEFEVKAKDFRAILDWQVHGLSHDTARAVCDAMGWEAPKKDGARNYRSTVEKQLKDTKSVEQWIVLLTLAENSLWFSSGYALSAKPLEEKAKSSGVSIAKVNAAAKAKPKKEKTKAR